MKLSIGKQRFYNNGNLLLPLLVDKDGTALRDAVPNWLNQEYELTTTSRTKGAGIGAKQLNRLLREKMFATIKGIHGETHVEEGAFFHHGIHGFDFSLYDEEHNLIQIRNNYIGNPGKFDGKTKLLQIYKQVGYKKKEWPQKIDALGHNNVQGDTVSDGQNIESTKSCLTIVGELQFGNWALVKHDLLRLLNSSDSLDIDYYIYIAPTGKLAEKLSDGIVTYELAIEAIQENHRIIKTPLWVIGLDCE